MSRAIRAWARDWMTAVATWEKANPRRPKEHKDDWDYRRMIGRERWATTVRRSGPGSDASVIFRMHRTDCVTWHSDGSVDIIAYPSVTTNAFVSNLVPNVHPYFTYPGGCLLGLGGVGDEEYAWRRVRYYRADEPIHIRPGKNPGSWVMDPVREKFKLIHLDKKKGNAALRATNYHAFSAWMAALDAFNESYDNRNANGHRSALSLLEDRQKWPYLRAMMSTQPDLEHLRRLIYADANCYYATYHDCLDYLGLKSARCSDLLSHLVD